MGASWQLSKNVEVSAYVGNLPPLQAAALVEPLDGTQANAACHCGIGIPLSPLISLSNGTFPHHRHSRRLGTSIGNPSAQKV
jgi:hypothetical protein